MSVRLRRARAKHFPFRVSQCLYDLAFVSFFSGVFFISVPSAGDGDASKEHASEGTTNHRTQMTWSPVSTIGTEMGRHAEISMTMAAVKDPKSRK